MRGHLSELRLVCYGITGPPLRLLQCISAGEFTFKTRLITTVPGYHSRAKSEMELCRTPKHAPLTRRICGFEKKRDILPGQVFHKQWPLEIVAGFNIALEETGHEM
jgi:hypothetical protein